MPRALPIGTDALLWLPLAAVVAHLLEEFVWPGGFLEWYRRYPPGFETAVSTRFIVLVNALFVALAIALPILGDSPQAWGMWLVVACIAGVNGVFHVIATVRARRYSPGLVTGALLYVPLAVGGGALLLARGLVALATAAQAVLVAAAYQFWSARKHRRSRVAL